MQPLEYTSVSVADDDNDGENDGIRRGRYPSAGNRGLIGLPCLVVALLGFLITVGGYYKFGRASVRHKRMAKNGLADGGGNGNGNGNVGSASSSYSSVEDSSDSSESSDEYDGFPDGDGNYNNNAVGFVNATTLLSLPGCDDYDCQTDRTGHGIPLMAGQALCNDNHRFGLTNDGIFLLHECGTDDAPAVAFNYTQHIMLEEGDDSDSNKKQHRYPVNMLYWIIQPNATFQVGQFHSESRKRSTILWQRDTIRENMQITKQCLHSPKLDCPYLHLHKAGNVVLNWIDAKTHRWMDRKIERCFTDLFQEPP